MLYGAPVLDAGIFGLKSLTIALWALMLLSGSAVAGDLPDHALTPGVVLDVTATQVCRPGYSKSVRNVQEAVKRKVFAEYGIEHPVKGAWEIDHLVSLELGGSNDVKNLWPQSYVTKPWNAHAKDRLEDRLHALVCKGTMTLPEAQKAISGDWMAAYARYLGASP